SDFCPLFAEHDGQGGGRNPVTQFDKDDVETIGLVKFDFLGLRTLTIIDWAVKAINRRGPGTGDQGPGTGDQGPGESEHKRDDHPVLPVPGPQSPISTSARFRWTTQRRTSCSRVATPSLYSSSRLAACASYCGGRSRTGSMT